MTVLEFYVYNQLKTLQPYLGLTFIGNTYMIVWFESDFIGLKVILYTDQSIHVKCFLNKYDY